MAAALGVNPDALAPGALTIRLPFMARKRGAGTQLVMGSSPAPARMTARFSRTSPGPGHGSGA
jgi:hypothetical protein